MVEETTKFIRIDLNQFKLHIYLKSEVELTLHFDSPSRRFYLSVIGLVVHEMKKLGRITSIPLQKHLDVLALLNKTVGMAAGSSKREHLLHRIYRKWKDALPDLENAPLFKVVGRKKRYDDLMEKVYGFSEAEKDWWANLFEYQGSNENVRLRFSIDRLNASLDDVIFVYGESSGLANGDAWKAFVSDLKEKLEEKSTPENVNGEFEKSEFPLLLQKKWSQAVPRKWQWPMLCVLIVLFVGTATLAVWKYNLFSPQVEMVSKDKIVFPLPDKPSIAVLPFHNMSDDPKQEYFADGLTEEVITGLSKFPHVFVIASASMFTYKEKDIKVQQISKELGVQYVLEGSIKKDGNRIRITAQLIDAIRGHHLWADIYDRELQDIFEIQDEITLKILNSLMVQLTEGEKDSYLKKYTNNLQAYLKFLEGFGYFTQGKFDESIKSLKEARTLDPQYAMAYAWESWIHLQKVFSPSPTFKQVLEKAFGSAQKCLNLDDELYACYMPLGIIYLAKKEYDNAISAEQRAVMLSPNSAFAATFLGYILRCAGRYDQALKELRRALRLNPLDRSFTLAQIGCTYLFMGRNAEAVAMCEKAVELAPHVLPYHIFLAVAYISEGRVEEARLEAAKIMEIQPNFSMEHYARILPYKNKADRDLIVNGLLKAGLK